MLASRISRLSAIESTVAFGSGKYQSTVIGFVSPLSKILTSTYHLVGVKWEPTVKEPTVFFPEDSKGDVFKS